ncbi:TPA: hypothetical protein PTV97_003763 [Clostridium botulinum]|nr:hypothetical protein [Clostridium botulinum]
MDIDKIAKEMTREEFLNSCYINNENGISYCPSIFDLKNFPYHICNPKENCKECWKNAIKDIKFKGENDMEKVIKDYLKLGMIVETRENNRYLFVNDCFMRKYSFIALNNYNDDLICSDNLKELDIMKIYTTKGNTLSDIFDFSNLTCIWERTGDKKVEFMEAIKAFNEGKIIKVKYNHPIDRETITETYDSEYTFHNDITPYKILNGEWYIEED